MAAPPRSGRGPPGRRTFLSRGLTHRLLPTSRSTHRTLPHSFLKTAILRLGTTNRRGLSTLPCCRSAFETAYGRPCGRVQRGGAEPVFASAGMVDTPVRPPVAVPSRVLHGPSGAATFRPSRPWASLGRVRHGWPRQGLVHTHYLTGTPWRLVVSQTIEAETAACSTAAGRGDADLVAAPLAGEVETGLGQGQEVLNWFCLLGGPPPSGREKTTSGRTCPDPTRSNSGRNRSSPSTLGRARGPGASCETGTGRPFGPSPADGRHRVGHTA